MLGDNIRKIRKAKKVSINNLSKTSGVSLGYLSDLENNKLDNPTVDKLKKIANALDVSVKLFFEEECKTDYLKKNIDLYERTFKTPQEAMKFILEQPSIMGFGGFDVNKMNDDEIVDFANELLRQLKLISYKYKK